MREQVADDYAFIEGAIALSDQRMEGAIATWRKAAEVGQCANCADVELALAFEQAALPDSAIARYEHYLATPTLYRIWNDGTKLASVYERPAELYLGRGDRQNAARYAAKFVELWQNADPEFQPRVQNKRELLRQLGARN